MLIDQTKLDIANTTVADRFNALFTVSSAKGGFEQFIDVVPASTMNVEIPFAAPTGSWLRWDGPKTFASLKAYKQAITGRRYHYSIDLDRVDLAYDQSGVVGKHVGAQMSQAQGNHIKIIADEMFISSGAGPLAYDGVAWLHASHPMADGSTQANKTTSALSFATYDAAYQAMTSFVGHNGQPLGIVPDTLVVGPKLRKTAFDIAGGNLRPVAVNSSNAYADPGGTLTPVAASAITNVFQGEIKVIVSDRLVGTQDDYAYLMCTSLPDKPFLLVEQRAPELITQFDMNSPLRFNLDKFAWSVETECCPAAGLPFLTYGFIL